MRNNICAYIHLILWLDCCSSLLSGISNNDITILQFNQSRASRIVTRTRIYYPIISVLKSLVIDNNIDLFIYKSIISKCSQYRIKSTMLWGKWHGGTQVYYISFHQLSLSLNAANMKNKAHERTDNFYSLRRVIMAVMNKNGACASIW